MYVYIKYEKRKPHLPVAVADTVTELAQILGIKPNIVSSSIYHKRPTYAKVWIEEDDDKLQIEKENAV